MADAPDTAELDGKLEDNVLVFIVSVKLPTSYPDVLSLNFTRGVNTSEVFDMSGTGSFHTKLNDLVAVWSLFEESFAFITIVYVPVRTLLLTSNLMSLFVVPPAEDMSGLLKSVFSTTIPLGYVILKFALLKVKPDDVSVNCI